MKLRISYERTNRQTDTQTERKTDRQTDGYGHVDKAGDVDSENKIYFLWGLARL